MNDDWREDWDAAAEPEPLRAPSPVLYEMLFAGMLGAAVAGGVAVVGSLLELDQRKPQGFTAAHACGLVLFFPLAFVVRAYLGLAVEMGSALLYKSTIGLAGTLFLFQMFDLSNLNGLAAGWQITAWSVFGVGLLILGILPFLSFDFTSSAAVRPAPAAKAASSPSSNQKASVLGGLGVLAIIFLKLVGGIGKLLAFKWVVQLFQGRKDLEPYAGIALLFLAVGYLVGFAGAKIRLRGRLGGMAAFVGWLELLGLAIFLVMFFAFLFAQADLIDRLKLNGAALAQAQEDLSNQWRPTFAGLGILNACGWAILTSWVFMALRNRVRPEGD
jgi:hypothetical protein